MVKFKLIKRTANREKGLVLREFDYFKSLREAVNNSNWSKSKRLARKLGKVERRAIQSKQDLFAEIDILRGSVFDEHQHILDETKRQIEIFMDIILKRISLVQGRIPDLLKKKPVNWNGLSKEVEICFTKGIEPLSVLLENLQEFIDEIENEITKKVNVILALKLDPSDKVITLLVLFGRKSAGMISLNLETYGKKYGIVEKKGLYFIYAKSDINFDRMDIAEFISKLDNLGLSHHHRNYIVEAYNNENKRIKIERINFWIAKGKAKLQALLNATGDIETGRALGYPETAIGSLNSLRTTEYLQLLQKKYTQKSVPEELLYIIFTPKFSEGKIREEHVAWGQENMKLVKYVAPDLHDEFIKERKRAYFKV